MTAIIFCGLAFGLTCLFPYYSGAVIPLCFGCYGRFVSTLDVRNAKKRSKLLIALVIFGLIGIALSVAFIIPLSEQYPTAIKCFFGGAAVGGVALAYRLGKNDDKVRAKEISIIIITAAISIAITFFSGGQTGSTSLEKERSPNDPRITVATLTNNSPFLVSKWLVTFPEGTVEACGGAELIYDRNLSDMISEITKSGAEHKTNAFSGGEIKPRGSATFTYVAKAGTRLDLNARISYKNDANVTVAAALSSFLAGISFILPGFSAQTAFNFFSVGGTIEAAAKTLSFGILIPVVIFATLGALITARVISSALKTRRALVCFILAGLCVGSGVETLPRTFVFGKEFLIGIGLFVLAAALSIAIGMAKTERDDLLAYMERYDDLPEEELISEQN